MGKPQRAGRDGCEMIFYMPSPLSYSSCDVFPALPLCEEGGHWERKEIVCDGDSEAEAEVTTLILGLRGRQPHASDQRREGPLPAQEEGSDLAVSSDYYHVCM